MVHIYSSWRGMRNFIALAATDDFCQMVKHIVFHIQPPGMVMGADTTSEALHRVVSPFTNLESIIITTSDGTAILYYGKGEKVTSFDYLLPMIKKVAACQRLQSLKINPDCNLF